MENGGFCSLKTIYFRKYYNMLFYALLCEITLAFSDDSHSLLWLLGNPSPGAYVKIRKDTKRYGRTVDSTVWSGLNSLTSSERRGHGHINKSKIGESCFFFLPPFISFGLMRFDVGSRPRTPGQEVAVLHL